MDRKSTKIAATCDYCGAPILVYPCKYHRAKNHFCSRACNNRFHNPEKNKTLMTPELRAKLSAARKKEDRVSYAKHFGRHEHRVVAEQMLGRPLNDKEIVHHIDGNKSNNDPSNLFIFPSQSEHAQWHMLDRYGKAPVLIGGDAQCVMSQENTKD